MSAAALREHTSFWTLLLSGVFTVLAMLPYGASAQETETAVIPAGTEVAPTLEVIGLPYETEQLLGDEVYGDFVLGPGKLEVSINPGETKVIEITVSNRTGVERIFEVGFEDMTGSSDPNQTVILLGGEHGPYSLKDYVSVKAPRFKLPHNQRARIPVTISIPPNTPAGGLYGSVLVSTVSLEAKSGTDGNTKPQSAIVSRIGSLFFVTIPGEVERKGGLKNFGTVPEARFYQAGPLTFGLLFENSGSIHLAPYGEISITNIFGEEVGFIELDPWFVLPGALRLREVSWNRDLLFGRYTATAKINRSYENVIDEMSYTFWVLPWKPLAIGFGIIFLIIFSLRVFFRNFEFKRKN